MEKKFSRPVLGPEILVGLTGPMPSQHRSWSHGPETFTEKDTVLSVIEISKHKINIINDHCFIISLSCIRNHTDQY